MERLMALMHYYKAFAVAAFVVGTNRRHEETTNLLVSLTFIGLHHDNVRSADAAASNPAEQISKGNAAKVE